MFLGSRRSTPFFLRSAGPLSALSAMLLLLGCNNQGAGGPPGDQGDGATVDHADGATVDHSDAGPGDHGDGPFADHLDSALVDHGDTGSEAAPAGGYALSISKGGNGTGRVTSTPAGIDCGTDCAEAYPAGTGVSLAANADSGSTFSGWSGDADCSDGEVTIDGDKSCVATFNLQQPGNRPPSANAQAVSTAENTPVSVTLSGSDPESDPLTYIIVTDPGHGTLTGNPPAVQYTPQANYNGPDSFTFKVSDGSSDSASATVSITVTPVNDPPVISRFTATPASGPVPLDVAFTLTASDADGTITSIRWDFDDDGTVDQTTSPPTFSVSHTYSSRGAYTARVTVEDDQAAVATATAVVNAASFFGPKNDLAAGSFPKSVAMGDLNGDAKPDLAVVNNSSTTVSLFFGDGTGTFSPKIDVTVNQMPSAVAIGDINEDGKADLVVANQVGGNAGISVLLGDGAGAFGTKTDFNGGNNPYDVDLGDLNNDGNLDIAVVNGGYQSVSVLLGNGKGAFESAESFPTPNAVYRAAVGDADGDGNVDVVAASEAGYVLVLRGDGSGALGPATNLPAGGASGTGGAESAAIADFNDDARPDLAAGTWHAGNVSASKNLSVILGVGAGSFGTQTEYDTVAVTAGAGWDVVFGDVNGDAVPDLLVTGLRVVSVLLGDGTGHFGPRSEFATGEQPMSIAIGDLNADGKPDLAAANSASDSVSVLLNTTAVPAFVSPSVLTVTKTSTGTAAANGTVTSTPPGIQCGTDCTETYQTGAVVTLVAVPDEGSVIKGWTGGCSGSGASTTVVMDGSKTCTAVFGPSPVAFERTDYDAQCGRGLALADVTGDGNLDFLTITTKSMTNTYYASLLVAKGNGSGGFTMNFGPFASNPYGINRLRGPVIGDLNGDGWPDLIMPREDADVSTTHRYITIKIGNGSGDFGAKTDIPAYNVGNATPYDAAIGDFNRDGKLDLAVTNFDDSGTLSIYVGDGTGGFPTRQEITTITNSGPLAAGDFNNDGKVDLVVARATSPRVAVHLGDGTGSFGSPVFYDATRYGYVNNATNAVAIGDLNGDAKPDIVVVNMHEVVVFLGDGGGAFGSPVFLNGGFLPWGVAIGDLSGDGKPDLAVTDEGNDSIVILIGDGTGAFPIRTTRSVDKGYPPVSPRFIAMGDLNRDGRPDLVVGDLVNPTHQYGDVSVLLNSTASTPFAPPRVLTVSKTGAGSGKITSTPTIGIACGTDCTESYQTGTAITLVAKPDAGSTFAGWSGDCAGTAVSATVVMNGNRSCNAEFQ